MLLLLALVLLSLPEVHLDFHSFSSLSLIVLLLILPHPHLVPLIVLLILWSFNSICILHLFFYPLHLFCPLPSAHSPTTSTNYSVSSTGSFPLLLINECSSPSTYVPSFPLILHLCSHSSALFFYCFFGTFTHSYAPSTGFYCLLHSFCHAFHLLPSFFCRFCPLPLFFWWCHLHLFFWSYYICICPCHLFFSCCIYSFPLMFSTHSSDFHSSPSSTHSSMLFTCSPFSTSGSCGSSAPSTFPTHDLFNLTGSSTSSTHSSAPSTCSSVPVNHWLNVLLSHPTFLLPHLYLCPFFCSFCPFTHVSSTRLSTHSFLLASLFCLIYSSFCPSSMCSTSWSSTWSSDPFIHSFFHPSTYFYFSAPSICLSVSSIGSSVPFTHSLVF